MTALAGAAAALLALPSVLAAAPPQPHRKSIRIVGGTSAQRQLAALTARRVAGPTIRQIAFRPPSLLLRRQGVRGSELVVSSTSARASRALWEAQLYIGSYLGLSERHPRAAVAAVRTAQTEAPASRVRSYDVFGSNPRALAVGNELRLLNQRVAAARARVIEERVLAAPARAIMLRVRVADPAAFLKHRTLPILRLLIRPKVPLLGYYLAVENASGQLVWATSWLPGTGSVFAIPRLDACSPVGHSELALHQLPCPAR